MQYSHLVKPLKNFIMKGGEEIVGEGNADQLVWVSGRDLEGLNLTFTWGFYSKIGNWHKEGLNPHIHPEDEILVFVGLDPKDINYLGAELEIYLGEEQESYIIDRPSAVIVPKNMPHCPLVTRKVERPFAHYTIYLGPEYKTTWLKREKKDRVQGKRYAHFIKPLVLQERFEKMRRRAGLEPSQIGPGNADSLVWLFGDDLEGLDVNFTWGFYSRPGIWHRGGAHVHPVDEILVFVGIDPSNIEYLGAELEIDMGREHERHIFNEPTVVICPKGFPHLPLITRWVDNPYSFFVIACGSEHESRFID